MANRKLAERDLAKAILSAPYDGVVAERRISVGTYVAKGDSPFALINDHDIEIEADVPADLMPHGSPFGRVIDIAISDPHTVKGAVRAVLPRENPRTRTRLVRIVLADEPQSGTLAVNRTVKIAFPSGRRQGVLSVAMDAVIRCDGLTQVMIATPDGAAARTVSLGLPLGPRFTVIEGLNEGDLAVVRGNERLAPGTPLKYRDPRLWT